MVRPADSILHLRYSASTSRPGRGVGPLQRARISSRLIAEIESALADEVSGTRGVLMPTPLDGKDTTLKKLRTTIAGLRGRTAIVETMKGSWGGDRADAPAQDWKVIRLGADPPETLRGICSDVSIAILSACGTRRWRLRVRVRPLGRRCEGGCTLRRCRWPERCRPSYVRPCRLPS